MTTNPLPDTPAHAIKEAFHALGGVQSNSTVFKWVADHYQNRWEERLLGRYLRACSVNHPLAIKLHPSYPRFLYNRAKGEFELYDQTKHGLFDESGYQDGQVPKGLADPGEADEMDEVFSRSSEFAQEAHLRDYLAKNLGTLEANLTLWTGNDESIEYGIQGRYIDILARDKDGIPVIIELKVRKGHEKTIGQALYYRAKLKQLLSVSKVRVIMIAADISEELRMASTEVTDVDVFSYQLAMKLHKVDVSAVFSPEGSQA